MYRFQGQYENSIIYFEDALSIAQTYDSRVEQGRALYSLGTVYASQGQFAKAVDSFEKALLTARGENYAETQSSIDPIGEGDALVGLGTTYQARGQHDDSLIYFESAKEVYNRIGSYANEMVALSNIGGYFLYKNQYDTAIETFELVLIAARANSDRMGEGIALGNIGLALASDKRYEESLLYYGQALAIFQEIGDRAGEGTAIANIGKVYQAQGQHDEARIKFDEALLIARELGKTQLEATALGNIGFTQYKQDQFADAYISLKAAISVADLIRANAGDDVARASFANSIAPSIALAVDVAIALEQPTDGFELSEQSRARSFLDSLSTGRVELGGEDELLYQMELIAYNRRLVTQNAYALALASGDASEIKLAKQNLDEAVEQHTEAVEEIAERSEKLTDLVPGRNKTLTLMEVQEQLAQRGSNSAIISFFLFEPFAEGEAARNAIAFVITSDGFQLVELSVGQDEIAKAVAEFRHAFNAPTPQTAHSTAAQNLYAWLIEPLLPHLAVEHLIVIPHQVLHYVPFSAFSTGDSYLDEQFSISYLPSASVMAFLNGTSEVGEEVLIFGNPQSNEGKNLESAEAEAQAISVLYDHPAYIGTTATKNVLYEQSADADIVHIAAHGVYNEVNPLESAIYFAVDGEEEGVLRVREVFGLALDSADLVILSACETQVGEISGDNVSDGDEIVGLTRAFMFAGTQSILSTLWQVDDQSTAILMQHFHEKLKEGVGKAEALREAQKYLRTEHPEYSDPYYWSGFVLNGEAGVDASPSFPIAQLIGALIIIASVIGLGLFMSNRRRVGRD